MRHGSKTRVQIHQSRTRGLKIQRKIDPCLTVVELNAGAEGKAALARPLTPQCPASTRDEMITGSFLSFESVALLFGILNSSQSPF